jgi:hypothetical protein
LCNLFSSYLHNYHKPAHCQLFCHLLSSHLHNYHKCLHYHSGIYLKHNLQRLDSVSVLRWNPFRSGDRLVLSVGSSFGRFPHNHVRGHQFVGAVSPQLILGCGWYGAFIDTLCKYTTCVMQSLKWSFLMVLVGGWLRRQRATCGRSRLTALRWPGDLWSKSAGGAAVARCSCASCRSRRGHQVSIGSDTVGST